MRQRDPDPTWGDESTPEAQKTVTGQNGDWHQRSEAETCLSPLLRRTTGGTCARSPTQHGRGHVPEARPAQRGGIGTCPPMSAPPFWSAAARRRFHSARRTRHLAVLNLPNHKRRHKPLPAHRIHPWSVPGTDPGDPSRPIGHRHTPGTDTPPVPPRPHAPTPLHFMPSPPPTPCPQTPAPNKCTPPCPSPSRRPRRSPPCTGTGA